MKISISNLAWNKKDDQKVADMMKSYGVRGVELALSKIWEDPTDVQDATIRNYGEYWRKNNIDIVATTSLLYGHPELTIFENKETRKKTFDYLKKMAQITHLLDGKVMMFGSPKNRLKGRLSNKETYQIASEFFTNIAEEVKKYDICFAIEPNPTIYGGDFILTTIEAVEFVKKLDCDNLGINLDSSTIASNKSDYSQAVKKAIPYACHAHISEPYLRLIPDGETDHIAFSKSLKKYNYDKWLSIEMLLNENSVYKINQTLEFVTKTYE